jgi:hypothetical protein
MTATFKRGDRVHVHVDGDFTVGPHDASGVWTSDGRYLFQAGDCTLIAKSAPVFRVGESFRHSDVRPEHQPPVGTIRRGDISHFAYHRVATGRPDDEPVWRATGASYGSKMTWTDFAGAFTVLYLPEDYRP